MKRHSKKDFLAACLLTALVVTALWQLIPEIESKKTGAQPQQPRIVFMSSKGTGQEAGQDINAVWSPALIALPARVMARNLPMEKRPQLEPVLDPPGSEPRYLKTRGADVAHIGEITPDIIKLPDWAGTGFTPQIEEKACFNVHTAAPGVRVDLSQELTGQVNLPDFSTGIFDNVSGQLHCKIHVRFDSYGKIRSAILDTPTDDKALNRKIIEKVLESSVENPETELSGYITIFYPGRT